MSFTLLTWVADLTRYWYPKLFHNFTFGITLQIWFRINGFEFYIHKLIFANTVPGKFQIIAKFNQNNLLLTMFKGLILTIDAISSWLNK